MIDKSEIEIMSSWDGDSDRPLVSICCLTYNHEDFIEETIDSFLMQKTNFPFEIIIGEDCSKDKTLTLIEQYKSKFPSLIKLITSENNVGGHENWLRTHDAAQGDYIAYCEGDDYFIGSNRLQLCFDTMKKDQEISFVFGPAVRFNNETKKEKLRNKYSNETAARIDLNWVLMKGGGFYPSSTAFFKKSVVSDLPGWFHKHCTGDYPLAVRAALLGKIHYIDEVLSAYRVHGKSMTNSIVEDKCRCKEIAETKRDVNLGFIAEILKEKIIDDKMRKALLDKEHYVYFSKLLDCGYKNRVLRAVFTAKTSLYYRTRLMAKFILRLFKRRQ